MYGPMVKLVDTGDLKSPAEKRTCSTQVRPTTNTAVVVMRDTRRNNRCVRFVSF